MTTRQWRNAIHVQRWPAPDSAHAATINNNTIQPRTGYHHNLHDYVSIAKILVGLTYKITKGSTIWFCFYVDSEIQSVECSAYFYRHAAAKSKAYPQVCSRQWFSTTLQWTAPQKTCCCHSRLKKATDQSATCRVGNLYRLPFPNSFVNLSLFISKCNSECLVVAYAFP